MIRAFYLLAATLCLTLVLSACDSGGDSGPEAVDCESRTGNTMTATVNGTSLCTDLGTASLFDVAGPRLSVVGLFENGRSSIVFSLENPAVGMFDLADVNADHDAMYGQEDETGYVVDRTEGSGSVTITELTGARVTGTFAFTGPGYDINDNPTGDQVQVTNGRFDFALGS